MVGDSDSLSTATVIPRHPQADMARFYFCLLVLTILDLRHAKQVDLNKMKESTVYNYKVQFEPQIILQSLDKLANDERSFDIKDLIKDLTENEDLKPQDKNSPTIVVSTTELPPLAPPFELPVEVSPLLPVEVPTTLVSTTSTPTELPVEAPTTLVPTTSTSTELPVEVPTTVLSTTSTSTELPVTVSTTVVSTTSTELPVTVSTSEISSTSTAAEFSIDVSTPAQEFQSEDSGTSTDTGGVNPTELEVPLVSTPVFSAMPFKPNSPKIPQQHFPQIHFPQINVPQVQAPRDMVQDPQDRGTQIQFPQDRIPLINYPLHNFIHNTFPFRCPCTRMMIPQKIYHPMYRYALV